MENERMPCLNAGFWIYFPTDADVATIKNQLPPNTGFDYFPDSIQATVIEVEDCYDWEIDTVLTQLFSLCDLDQLYRVAEEFGGRIHIGLWYYSYNDVGPAVIFDGKNMEIIHRLHADISIDAY